MKSRRSQPNNEADVLAAEFNKSRVLGLGQELHSVEEKGGFDNIFVLLKTLQKDN